MRQIRLKDSSTKVYLPRSVTNSPHRSQPAKSVPRINISGNQTLLCTDNTDNDVKNLSAFDPKSFWMDNNQHYNDKKLLSSYGDASFIESSLIYQQDKPFQLKNANGESENSLPSIRPSQRDSGAVPDLKQLMNLATSRDLCLNLVGPVGVKYTLNERDSFRGHVPTTQRPDQFLRASPFLVRTKGGREKGRSLSYSTLLEKSFVNPINRSEKEQKEDCSGDILERILKQEGKYSVQKKESGQGCLPTNNVYKMKAMSKKASMSQLKSDFLQKTRIVDTKDITGIYIPVLKTRR